MLDEGRKTKDEKVVFVLGLSSLVGASLPPLLKRHKGTRRRAIVIGLGPNKAIVGQLLANMCHPACHPAECKRGREQVKRQTQGVQQRRAVKLNIWVELALGEVRVLSDHLPDLL